mmetsp:Transcript_26993/g.58760  ORF Transcript_26993/g.58760 Transcript_26993/m.58760 type:complete len:310 (+) Transcript_26993:52-981(+)
MADHANKRRLSGQLLDNLNAPHCCRTCWSSSRHLHEVPHHLARQCHRGPAVPQSPDGASDSVALELLGRSLGLQPRPDGRGVGEGAPRLHGESELVQGAGGGVADGLVWVCRGRYQVLDERRGPLAKGAQTLRGELPHSGVAVFQGRGEVLRVNHCRSAHGAEAHGGRLPHIGVGGTERWGELRSMGGAALRDFLHLRLRGKVGWGWSCFALEMPWNGLHGLAQKGQIPSVISQSGDVPGALEGPPVQESQLHRKPELIQSANTGGFHRRILVLLCRHRKQSLGVLSACETKRAQCEGGNLPHAVVAVV